MRRAVRINENRREGTVPPGRGPASIDGKRRIMRMGNKGNKKAGKGLAQREGLSLIITAMEEYAEGSQVPLTTHERTLLSDLKEKLTARTPISREEGNRAFGILRSKDPKAAEGVLRQIKALKK